MILRTALAASLSVVTAAQGGRFFGALQSRSIEPIQAGPSMPAPPPRTLGLPGPEPGPSWESWWSLHGPRIVAPLSSAAPRPADAIARADADRIAGTLRKVLPQAPRELAVPTLLALGKLARRTADETTPPKALVDALDHQDLATRHAAILALGISGRAASAPLLEARIPRRATGSGQHPLTRALALYALGLIATENPGPGMEQRVVAAAQSALGKKVEEPISVRVGALHALALARPRDPVTLRAALRLLAEAEKDARLSLQAPLCVAAILGPNHDESEAWRARYVAELQTPTGRQNSPARRSAVALALGGLCATVEDQASRDYDAMMALVEHTRTPETSAVSRAAAWAALGSIGGESVRRILGRSLTKVSHADRAWLAIAIATAHSRALESGVDPVDAVDKNARTALQRGYTRRRPPSTRGAYACALGVTGCDAATDELLTSFERYSHRAQESQPTALAIALLEGAGASELLTQTFRKSVRRPHLSFATATALARVDGPTANRELLLVLPTASNAALRAGIAMGLGHSADAATLRALEKILLDDGVPVDNRAAAARALGCALEPGTPWRDRIGPLVHLQATTSALVDSPVSVLGQL